MTAERSSLIEDECNVLFLSHSQGTTIQGQEDKKGQGCDKKDKDLSMEKDKEKGQGQSSQGQEGQESEQKGQEQKQEVEVELEEQCDIEKEIYA